MLAIQVARGYAQVEPARRKARKALGPHFHPVTSDVGGRCPTNGCTQRQLYHTR